MVATDGRQRPGGRAGLLRFMQRFHFTLDSVRDLREDRQTAAMMALADRIRTHAHAQAAAERVAAPATARREAALVGAGRAAALLVQADRDRDAARLRLEAATVELRDTSFGVDVGPRRPGRGPAGAGERPRSSRSAAARSTAPPAPARRSASSPTCSRRAPRARPSPPPAEGSGMSVTDALARVSAIQAQLAALAPPPPDAGRAGSCAGVRVGARRPDLDRRRAARHRRDRLARHAIALRRHDHAGRERGRRAAGAGQGRGEGRVRASTRRPRPASARRG